MNTFYEKGVQSGVRSLSEEEARHCIQVLRHQTGDEILVIDGTGGEFNCKLTSVSKQTCEFEVFEEKKIPRKPFRVHLAIAPTKNIDRVEWMIEKLGELAVDEVTFLHTRNGERSRLRLDRLEKKALSAMKQCAGRYLMKINDLTPFDEFISTCSSEEKWMAHLNEGTKYLGSVASQNKSVCILIGPEGDFDPAEIELAESAGFKSVSLGKSTLRTETAGLMACHFINVMNES